MILSGCAVGVMYHISGEFDNHLNKEIKKRDLPIMGKHSSLFMILHYTGEREFKEVAKVWNKSKSTLCDIITRYKNLGLIEKKTCECDKRDVKVKLTAEGEKYAVELDQIAEEFFNIVTDGLEDPEKDVLKNILTKMKGNLMKLKNL